MIKSKSIIYIVDDDKSILKALKRLIISEGLEAETFFSAQDFLRCEKESKNQKGEK